MAIEVRQCKLIAWTQVTIVKTMVTKFRLKTGRLCTEICILLSEYLVTEVEILQITEKHLCSREYKAALGFEQYNTS